MPNSIAVALLVVSTLIALMLGFTTYQNLRAQFSPVTSTPYQAALLTNGQSIFGRLEILDTSHAVLRDVFYIQSRVNPETKQAANVLVKRGSEWHAPDRMILNRSHILLIEPVKEDSQVARLIEQQNAKR